MYDIEKAVETGLKIAADNTHGYDQDHRLGDPDYDCSSFVAACLRSGGFPVEEDSWSGNLYDQLIHCGFEPVTGEPKAGDIYLTPGKHVVMAVSPTKIVHASINEKGKVTDGKPGDQTGKEICTRSFYIPSYGWKYHLRYMSDPEHIGAYLAPKLLCEIMDGKYGVYPEREEKITSMGLDYHTVQYLVNQTVEANEGL